MATAPRSVADIEAKAPESFPIGVRAPLMITEPAMSWGPLSNRCYLGVSLGRATRTRPEGAGGLLGGLSARPTDGGPDHGPHRIGFAVGVEAHGVGLGLGGGPRRG